MRPSYVKSLLLTASALSMLVAIDVHAELVCTVERVGTDEFRGISGSSDSNIIAVGKKGAIYIFDGSAWNAMANASKDDLNDVEVVDDNTAFAVGQDGEVLQLSGGVWTSIGGFTTEDLFGVWAASTTEVYAVGKEGEIYRYDGTSWFDESAAAGTNDKNLEDAWGDDSAFYAVNEDGVLYRRDRLSGSWSAPDSACTIGDKFGDLWGDGDGNLFLVGKKDVYLYDGASCGSLAAASEDLFGISGWNPGGRVTAVGKKGTVFEYDGTNWTETQVGNKELKDDWVSPTGNAYFAGKNKELTVCECIDCAVSGPAQFVITHDSYGINCQSEVVQVQVIDSNTGTPKNDYNSQITLDTQNGFGSWGRVTGGGLFNDATADDGLATYDWPLGETSAAFSLAYLDGPENVDIDVYQSDDTGVRDNDAEGLIRFSPSGFTLTANPLSNPPPAVLVPFSATQVAGVDFAVNIAAFGQTPSDPVCGIIEAYTGPRNLKFWFDFVNPGSGSVAATIDTDAIPALESSAAAQPVTFTNGQAVVTGKYKDVGRIQISVKDDSEPHPDLPNGIRGATAGFVVKPYQFVLSNIEDGAGNPNPAAADATGGTFVAAGEPFSITVTAVDAEGDITPNYGREAIAESVELATNLVAPLAGDNPLLGSGFGPFVAGQATGATFNWPEVGIITLTPSVGDGDYLGAGDVVGATSGNVGRFYAHHFTAALNTPTFATSCAAGSFSYIGETFGYSNQPVITLTARALAGEVTENYAGGFFKVDSSSLSVPLYTSAPATLDSSGLPGGDPVIAETGAGTGTLTFGSGGGLFYTRGAEQAPFDADIRLSIDVADTDGAAASNPIIFGTAGGMLFDSGAEMRYGRGQMQNAYGSELVNLALPFRMEYFLDAATGYVPNIDDSCTSPVAVSFGAFTENLAAGETCVLDTGAPGASGAGCAVAGLPGLRFRSPPLGGDFNLHLQAPGENNDGSTTVTVDVPDWLEFDWNTGLPGLEDPSGTAVFGIFRGSDRRIYIRELY